MIPHIIQRVLSENQNAVFVFDIDGVLASYEYCDYNHGYPYYIWENIITKGDPYQYAQPFKVMQEFIKEHSINCYTCSVVSGSNEIYFKNDFLTRNYDILPTHRCYVDNRDRKLEILNILWEERFDIEDPHHIVMIDDTIEILENIVDNSDFSTVHVSSFLN